MSLILENLSFSLKKQFLIENISLNLKPGILYGILGPNGSGKTTLLKTLSGILTPSTGQIFWNGADLSHHSRNQMRSIFSLVPQNPALYFDYTAFQMVAMGYYPQNFRSKEAEHEFEKALKQVDCWHLKDKLISQVSGGERQRIYIARALVNQAPILLLDEPTTHLDLRHQLEIWKILRQLIQSGKLVLTAIHDLQAAERFCDELIVLKKGRCQATGPYSSIMTPSFLEENFGVQLNPAGNFELYISDQKALNN